MGNIVWRDHNTYLKTWNTETREYNEEQVDTVAPYLQCEVAIEGVFLFRDFLTLVERDADFYQLVFNRALGSFPVEAYIDDAKTMRKKPNESDLKRVEVYHVCEIHDYRHQKKNPSIDFNVYDGFHGIGPYTCKETGTHAEEMGLAIEFSPISDYMDVPLVLNEAVDIWRYGEVIKNSPTGYIPDKIEAGMMAFTVYDVLKTILNEISFCGLPKDRDISLAKFDDSMDEIKDALKSGDMSKFKKIDDLKKELELDDDVENQDGNEP